MDSIILETVSRGKKTSKQTGVHLSKGKLARVGDTRLTVMNLSSHVKIYQKRGVCNLGDCVAQPSTGCQAQPWRPPMLAGWSWWS